MKIRCATAAGMLLAVLAVRSYARSDSTATGWKAGAETVEKAEKGHPGFNFREENVPPYTLPDPLVSFDGTRIGDVKAWKSRRRPELLRFFESRMYGKSPGKPKALRFNVFDHEPKALQGKAVRKQVGISLNRNGKKWSMDLLLYLPAARQTPAPVFLILNFDGNHTVWPDTAVRIRNRWSWNKTRGAFLETPAPGERGRADLRYSSSVYPVDKMMERGYGLATAYYGDIDPDYDDGFRDGVHPLFYGRGRNAPENDEWGSFAAWAWGLSRAMDYLESDPGVDGKRVIVAGFSRLGKTALWAAAADERFAMAVLNESGCGGAAPSKRVFGETVERMAAAHPQWFCKNVQWMIRRESAMPVDQHLLLCMIAPRPLYVSSADEDLWADPRGEFISAAEAGKVYRLFGLTGLSSYTMPPLDTPLLDGTVGYHIRTGKHALLEYDWERFMDFADKQFENKLKIKIRRLED